MNHAIEIKCSTFASSSKLQSLFKKSPNFDPSRVVYWWKCSFPSCNAGYVGQTTDFKTRVIAHRNVKTSAIAEHLNLVHDINNSIQQGRQLSKIVVPSSFIVLRQANNVYDLKLWEAIFIKLNASTLNKRDDINNINLKIY